MKHLHALYEQLVFDAKQKRFQIELLIVEASVMEKLSYNLRDALDKQKVYDEKHNDTPSHTL